VEDTNFLAAYQNTMEKKRTCNYKGKRSPGCMKHGLKNLSSSQDHTSISLRQFCNLKYDFNIFNICFVSRKSKHKSSKSMIDDISQLGL